TRPYQLREGASYKRGRDGFHPIRNFPKKEKMERRTCIRESTADFGFDLPRSYERSHHSMNLLAVVRKAALEDRCSRIEPHAPDGRGLPPRSIRGRKK